MKGVLGLETTSSEHGVEALSTRGINPLRARADGDVRLWGARTLSSDPEWKYVNIRLLFEPRVILSSVPYQLFR